MTARDTSGPLRRPATAADADTVQIRSVATALWRGKGLIALCMLGGMILFYGLVSQITPLYTSRASVMLDPRAVQLMGSDSVVSDLTLNNPLLDTEAGVLRSNLLLEEVIGGFDPQRLAGLDPANRPAPPTARVRTAIGTGIGQVRALVGLAADPRPDPASAMSDEDRRMRRLVGALRNSMTVWREGTSYLISVSVETADPELSMLLANAIVQVYLDRQAEQLNASVRDAAGFLADRVERMRDQVTLAETAVEDYRIGQLADGGGSIEALSQQMMDLSTQIAVARADLVSAEARYRQIQSVTQQQGFAEAAELLSSPFVLSLREQRSVLVREEADLASRYDTDHPDRVRRRASVALIDRELTSEVGKIVDGLNNDVAVARIRVESLQDSLAALEGRSADISLASLELRQLDREATAARASYEAMLTRLNDTRSIEELNRPDARIIERAVIPGVPSAPRLTLITAFGGVLGLSAGVVAVYVLAMSRRGFSSPVQVERVTGFPALTTLPRCRWRNLRGMLAAIRSAPYATFPERLRQARALLRSPGGAKRARIIMVTSSVPSEGKSSTAVAMAHLEGLAGRSCVLFDFDTRRSTLAKQLNYQPPHGELADYLRGDRDLADVTFRDPALGFDLITNARPVPHLADAVPPARIEAILAELAGRYDTVLIDTPPVLMVSDSMGLVPHVDLVMVLVRQDRTRQQALQETLRRLSEMGAASIQIAMTMTDLRHDQDAFGVADSYSYGPV